MMPPGVGVRRRAGFTLVEMTISMALMAIILLSAYLCLNAGFATQRMLDPRLEAVQTARVALNLLTADLRSACPLAKNAEFIGMNRTLGEVEADNLDFATHHYTPRRAGEGDYCQVSYFVAADPASGEFVLWRRRNPRIGLDPFQGGSREEIARGVRQLRLEYYDGYAWYETWGDPDGREGTAGSLRLEPNLSGLPEAVRITLALGTGGSPPQASSTPTPANPSTDSADVADPANTGWPVPATGSRPKARAGEPLLVFQTVVRIHRLASPSPGGSGGAAGTSTGEPTEAPGTPGVSAPGAPPPGGGS